MIWLWIALFFIATYFLAWLVPHLTGPFWEIVYTIAVGPVTLVFCLLLCIRELFYLGEDL